MSVLPGLWGECPDLIIAGTAPGRESAKRGLYYAKPGNRFWQILHQAELTPCELRPEDCGRLSEYRIGLTDLAKDAAHG
jgi:TDG/mug DNA glycosylase family protein